MTFVKTFPKTTDKSAYPVWIEIRLTEKEEEEMETKCRKENAKLMSVCLEDARIIMQKHKLLETQTNIIETAKALFEKRASHEIYYKEELARQKFDALYSNNESSESSEKTD